MDPRLLIAIGDVLSGENLQTIASSGSASKTGVEVRQALLVQAGSQKASTGTPIPLLRGVAQTDATHAAAGGGAKSAGGRGVEGGIKTLDQAELTAQLAVYGVKATAIVAAVIVRYGVLVHRDRKAAREELSGSL
ncbi:hypothetical protein I6E68_02720 [Salinibacterium sp. NSLL150]|uniref:hypothetical protein n=1 Tax=unclassified Salinibacterium TaxID=2632331 RepID=UPI0018CDF660|nr:MULTISPECIES: hypothetical protein [unclassified Salinibacterium]MBH0098051.1 hypothetical protein [Salinibacterium sp. NSLL35]MBH0100806.1 hypothetical protein [Salinibacterium sp. NSLL150]MBH0103565.1 hypothetical protein [Salinibacterium sp. NSLL16]MBH0106326.1 hypothetical protein [Salinibacterium sp. NSLL17]